MLPSAARRAKLTAMQSEVIAILETRTGANLGQLIASRGGVAMLAPALAEEPDLDPNELRGLVELWRTHPMKIVIFQTGVGTRALFQATDELGLTQELEIIAGIPVTHEHVLIQQYGAPNRELRAALEGLGAEVHEIATYRWALPADLRPLLNLIAALAQGRVDALVFTSAVQVHNLFSLAEPAQAGALAEQINRCVVASIGPVCSRALERFGVKPTFEAKPPKLGPLLTALEGALSARRPD
jgi:uroporphyrinogen-III synthase